MSTLDCTQSTNLGPRLVNRNGRTCLAASKSDKGINSYHWLTAFILRIFCVQIHEIRDTYGNSYLFNKKSLMKWIKLNTELGIKMISDYPRYQLLPNPSDNAIDQEFFYIVMRMTNLHKENDFEALRASMYK